MAIPSQVSPRTGASVIVQNGDKVLLIKRGKEPYLGHWSIPGGAQELGETLEQAARRELEEETSLVAEELEFLRVVDRITRNGAGEITHHYVLAMYRAKKVCGKPIASDDASDIGWYSIHDIDSLTTTPEIPKLLAEFLDEKFTQI